MADPRSLKAAYENAALAAKAAKDARDKARDEWIAAWVQENSIPVGTVQREIYTNGTEGRLFYLAGVRCQIHRGKVFLQDYVVRWLIFHGSTDHYWGRITCAGRWLTFRPYDEAKDGPIPPLPEQENVTSNG